jgi:hypothetical protein
MEELKINTSDKVLHLSCGHDELVQWQKAPFHACMWNAATDGHIIIGYKGAAEYPDLASDKNAARMDEYLSGTYGKLKPVSGVLHASELIEAMDNWPRTSEDECDVCNGSGYDMDDENIRVECTVCGGAGELHAGPDQEQFLARNGCVYIQGIGHFKHFTFAKLAPILKEIGADRLQITHGGVDSMMRLEVVGTPYVIGVMPVLLGTLDDAPFRTLFPL